MSAADIIGIVSFGIQATSMLYKACKSVKNAPAEMEALLLETAAAEDLLQKIYTSHHSPHSSVSPTPGETHGEQPRLYAALIERAKTLEKDVKAFMEKTTKVGKDGEARELKRRRRLLHPSEITEMTEHVRAFNLAATAVASAHEISIELQSATDSILQSIGAFHASYTTNSARSPETFTTVQDLKPKVDTIEQDVKEIKVLIRRTMVIAAQQQRDGQHQLLDELSAFRKDRETSDSSRLSLPDAPIGGHQSCNQILPHFARPSTPPEATNTGYIPSSNLSASVETSTADYQDEVVDRESCPADCRCQCHKPSSHPPSIPWWFRLLIPARRLSSLQSAMRGCDDPQCIQMRESIETIKLYVPVCFMHVEATIRLGSLPIQFVIQTPRVVPEVLGDVLSISLEELKRRLATRAVTLNDVDPKGRTILHRLTQRVARDPGPGYELMRYAIDAGAPKDWEMNRTTVLEFFVLDIGILVGSGKCQESVEWFMRTIGRPLFGVDLDEVHESLRRKLGWTDLHVAVRNPSPALDVAAMLHRLPEFRSQVNTRDRFGWPPLQYAVFSCPSVADVLLKAGANPRSDSRALLCAAYTKSLAAIGPFIRAGVDVNTQDDTNYHRTILHYAVAAWPLAEPDSRVALELLRHAAHLLDWTIADAFGRAPLPCALHALARFPHDDQLSIIVELFRSRKVPIGAQCISTSRLAGVSEAVASLASTSLIAAGLAGNVPAVGELIRLGAMVNERDSTGRTLRHLVGMGVVPNGYKIALELERHGGYGIDYLAKTVDGQTALQLAQETVDLLVNCEDVPDELRKEAADILGLFKRVWLPEGGTYIYPCMDPRYCFTCSSLPCACIDDTGLSIPGAFVGR